MYVHVRDRPRTERQRAADLGEPLLDEIPYGLSL
jgi:hypothetical protein